VKDSTCNPNNEVSILPKESNQNANADKRCEEADALDAGSGNELKSDGLMLVQAKDRPDNDASMVPPKENDLNDFGSFFMEDVEFPDRGGAEDDVPNVGYQNKDSSDGEATQQNEIQTEERGEPLIVIAATASEQLTKCGSGKEMKKVETLASTGTSTISLSSSRMTSGNIRHHCDSMMACSLGLGNGKQWCSVSQSVIETAKSMCHRLDVLSQLEQEVTSVAKVWLAAYPLPLLPPARQTLRSAMLAVFPPVATKYSRFTSVPQFVETRWLRTERNVFQWEGKEPEQQMKEPLLLDEKSLDNLAYARTSHEFQSLYSACVCALCQLYEHETRANDKSPFVLTQKYMVRGYARACHHFESWDHIQSIQYFSSLLVAGADVSELSTRPSEGDTVHYSTNCSGVYWRAGSPGEQTGRSKVPDIYDAHHDKKCCDSFEKYRTRHTEEYQRKTRECELNGSFRYKEVVVETERGPRLGSWFADGCQNNRVQGQFTCQTCLDKQNEPSIQKYFERKEKNPTRLTLHYAPTDTAKGKLTEAQERITEQQRQIQALKQQARNLEYARSKQNTFSHINLPEAGKRTLQEEMLVNMLENVKKPPKARRYTNEIVQVSTKFHQSLGKGQGEQLEKLLSLPSHTTQERRKDRTATISLGYNGHILDVAQRLWSNSGLNLCMDAFRVQRVVAAYRPKSNQFDAEWINSRSDKNAPVPNDRKHL
jgi:hypothetical protein